MSSSEFSDSDVDMEEHASGSDSESEDIAGGRDRSVELVVRRSRFKKVKISDQKDPSRKPSKKEKNKSTGKGRNFGKLAHLMNMTLDIFFEITSHLQPLDILQLSRVSKQFRSYFASKNSRHIWVAAKRNLAAPMPECPTDLSEPQYISLMFEHHCHACGKNRAQKVDFALRVRFCGPCFDENVVKGTRILRAHPQLPETIFTLVPRSLLKSHGVIGKRRFNNLDNGRSNAYYFAELESVIARYKKLQSDHTALEAYQTQKKAIASQMMKDAITLTGWVFSNKSNKLDEDKEHTKNRRASIEAKLVELGWDRKYFPDRFQSYEYYYEWSKLLNQPRELSPRIWKAIYPKIEGILTKNKEKEALRELRTRCGERQREFAPIWEDYAKGIQNSDERDIMPDHLDVCDFPPVKKVIFEDKGHIPFTKTRWESIVHCIPEQLDLFRKTVKYTLVKRLNATTSQGRIDSNYYRFDALPGPEEVLDFNALDHASALYQCACQCGGFVAGLPGILRHQCIANRRWTFICTQLYREAAVKPTVEMILKVLELPEDTSLVTVQALDGRFLCLCGHPEHKGPMSFTSLVAHIVQQNNEYESVQQLKGYGGLNFGDTDIDFYNDHSLTSEEPFVALLSGDQSDGMTLLVEPGNGDHLDEGVVSTSKICKYCFALGSFRLTFKSKDDMNYHMKAKHHREKVNDDDDDVLDSLGLLQWRSRMNMGLRY